MKRKIIKFKYLIAWYIGAVLCFLLYFSGIVSLYVKFRRKYLKQYITIVLMYHRVHDDDDDPDISVSTKKFRDQMKYLKENFDIISVDELVDRFERNHEIHEDTAAITFDDGFRDNYVNAYPILRHYDIPAAIFIITGAIDQDNKMLRSEEIVSMQKGNITFGAHTMTHKVLSEVGTDDARSEILGSKETLAGILHKSVHYFAYPHGKRNRDFGDEAINIVKESGFRAAFSTDNGLIGNSMDLLTLQRIGMRNFPLFVFKGRISGIFESGLLCWLRRLIRI